MFNSEKEKRAFRIGRISGFYATKKKKPKTKAKINKKIVTPRFKGATFVNGEFWDTNFKKPKKISKDFIKKLRKQYQPDNAPKLSDAQIVNNYVMHMRRKYGSFDTKTGEFLGLLGEN